VKRIALTALVIVALASPVHAQVGDSVAVAPDWEFSVEFSVEARSAIA
jgi:hypothetical protein